MSDPIPALETRRDRILQLIAGLGDMRPGSLSSRSRPCGKTTCQCRSPGGKPHGPYWSLTFKIKGKTVCCFQLFFVGFVPDSAVTKWLGNRTNLEWQAEATARQAAYSV